MRDLPEGWVEKELGEVADIIDGDRGKNYPNGQDFSADGYCLFLNTKNIPNTTFSFSEKIFITKEKDASLRKGKLKRGDFVLTTRGTIGNYAYFSDDIPYDNIRINSGMVLLRTTVVKGFFYYYLGSNLFKHQVVSLQSGSAQPQLPIKDLKMFVVNLPPLPEQKAIADMLSSFDEKIELLREQNKTLETLAQTIFKEWFVHFNFPDQHGNPYRNNGGAMVESELGLIPKSWRVGKLGEEFDITIGRTPPRKEQHWFSNTPTGKKWSSIKDIVNSGVYLFETSEYITDDAISKFNIPIIPENTVVLSFKMTVGKLAITTEDMLSNEAIAHMKIKPSSYFISEYIYLFLHGLDFNSLGSTSSIVTAINSTMIKQIQLLVPDEKAIGSFSEVMKPIFEKVKNNSSQIQTLSKNRDTLLPKLMSGQVRVGGKAS